MSLFKSVAKVVAAPYTAGASLLSGSNKASDWVSGALGNTIPVVAGAVGSGTGSSFGWLSSLLSAGLGGISDILKDKYNLANQKELAKYNADQQLRLNTDAFNKNLQMWNMENAYNSPAEQMKRFEAAGLNPNLIYDQQNTSGSAPTFEAPTFSTGQFNPTDTRVQRQQLALAMQEHKAQIQNQQIENMMKAQSLELSRRTADREDRLADAQIRSLEANLGLRSFDNNLRFNEQHEQNSWRRYQDALDNWQREYDSIGKQHMFPNGYHAEKHRKEWLSKHRKPMYMDYL